MPYKLFKLAYDSGIKVEYLDMQTELEAFYLCRPDCPPIIALSEKLFENKAHYRTVFAHELGHHFTGTKSNVTHTYMHYKDRIEMNREEYYAMAWAAEYLMPDDDIDEAFQKGIMEISDLGRYFTVDAELVKLRLVLFFCKYRRKNISNKTDGG